jgi:NitT/TauT family transport system ATP-binding protein
LRLQDVSKSFPSNGKELIVLDSVRVDVFEGEFVVLVGPSGCGKTTLLNLVAGLDEPTRGQLLVQDRPIAGPGADRMMMFQEHALFPWLSVLDNVMFGLRYLPHLSRAQCRERARHFLDMVELADSANARIHELSGGMRQRVALARALAPDPGLILFDEPFGSLDALTRERLYVQLQAVMSKTRKTCVFVTHNVREAACLGDRVVVLSAHPGRIRTILDIPLPRPRDFYDPEVSRLGGSILRELRAAESPS